MVDRREPINEQGKAHGGIRAIDRRLVISEDHGADRHAETVLERQSDLIGVATLADPGLCTANVLDAF